MISPFSEWETSGILKDYECQNAARSHSQLKANKSSCVIASIRAIFVQLAFLVVLNLIHRCGFLAPGHYVINARARSPHRDSCPHFRAIFFWFYHPAGHKWHRNWTPARVLDCSLCANWLCQPARWRAAMQRPPFFDACSLGAGLWL